VRKVRVFCATRQTVTLPVRGCVLAVPEGEEEELEDETEALIERDFEIGQFIRERIVSRAVLYFTGDEVDAEVLKHSFSCNFCVLEQYVLL